MNKFDHKTRVKLHAYFSIAAICLPFVSSMVAVALSGSRGYAGMGPFVLLPIIQLVYSFVFIKNSAYLAVLASVLISIVAHFLSISVIENNVLVIGIDRYGYFDFLLIYIVCSIVLWELAYASVSRFHNENSI